MIGSFVEVWSAVTAFIAQLFPRVIELFYVDSTGLTFVGTLAVIMAGISLVLLVWNLIRSFFPMHG